MENPQLRAKLVIASELRNASNGISGFMLYREGQFMQYIEGEQASLNALFSNICNDPRHDVRCHVRASVQARRFPNWLMKQDPVDSCDAMALDSLWNMLNATALGTSAEGVWATLDAYARFVYLQL